jgi:hypothetical protein
MDTKIIDMIFRFGHILSITPQSVKLNRKLTYFQKFFGLLIYVLITTSFNFYFFAIKQINTNPSDTQRILTILMMVIFAMYDFNILIIVKFHKQSQWIPFNEISWRYTVSQEQIQTILLAVCDIAVDRNYSYIGWSRFSFNFFERS